MLASITADAFVTSNMALDLRNVYTRETGELCEPDTRRGQ